MAFNSFPSLAERRLLDWAEHCCQELYFYWLTVIDQNKRNMPILKMSGLFVKGWVGITLDWPICGLSIASGGLPFQTVDSLGGLSKVLHLRLLPFLSFFLSFFPRIPGHWPLQPTRASVDKGGSWIRVWLELIDRPPLLRGCLLGGVLEA